MINGRELARVISEEAPITAGKPTYGHAPGMDNKAKADYALTKFPLPAVEQMALVIEEVFWASMLAEEGRPCRPRLLYLPSKDPVRSVHWLQEPVQLTREKLRKMTPVQGALGYLVWEHQSGAPMITGVEPRQGGDPPELIIAAHSAGALDITWLGFRVVTLRAGESSRLSNNGLPNSIDVFRLISKLLGPVDEPIICLGAIVRAISEQGHGGALWIVREGSSLVDLQICQVLKSDPRPLLERFQRNEQRQPWLASIAHLAAVDGAVVLDARMQVQRFATFIKVGDTVSVLQRMPGGEEKEILSSHLGGGRHHSAVEFCRRFAPAAAFVVSEDGRVLAIWSETTEKIMCSEISLLGFSPWL